MRTLTRLLCGLSVSSLLVGQTLAADKPPKCKWDGEAKDEFTGADGRWMEMNFGLRFRPAVSGSIPFEVKYSASGLTDQRWTEPIRLLLVDGAVAELPPAEPIPGVLNPYGYTVYAIRGLIPVDVARKIAEVGVEKIRYTPPISGQDRTMEWDGGDRKAFTRIVTCAALG